MLILSIVHMFAQSLFGYLTCVSTYLRMYGPMYIRMITRKWNSAYSHTCVQYT